MIGIPLTVTLIFALMPSFSLAAISLKYDTAAHLAQQEKWEAAGQKLQELVVDNPDRPDLLYDAGVVSYQQGDFQTARAYFSNVTKLETVPPTVKEQAHFNLGNTQVALNQLSDAIEQYEQTLVLNSDNERAKHNLELVKKMLEQQQQQEQNNEQQEQDENQDTLYS